MSIKLDSINWSVCVCVHTTGHIATHGDAVLQDLIEVLKKKEKRNDVCKQTDFGFDKIHWAGNVLGMHRAKEIVKCAVFYTLFYTCGSRESITHWWWKIRNWIRIIERH